MGANLLRYPLVKRLLLSRWPQFGVMLLALAGFLLAILAGLLGTPAGSRNFSIVFVWIAWWAALMLLIVPFFGRGWCSVCPIPAPGEWLQRGALLAPRGKGWGLGKRWPNRLRNIWLQNGAFTLIALFSAVVLTQPRVTGAVLAAFLFLAAAVSMIYERRAFCRYLCPVGGFIGLYAQLAPLELRVIEPAVCAAHTEKTCYTGNDQGYGCPWQVFPGGLVKNTSCGLCMECLRTCPQENIALNLRSFASDLEARRGGRALPAVKPDEAYKAFIMLGTALAYSAVLLGPWGAIKQAAYNLGSLPWLGYALGLLGFLLVILPGVFWLAARLGAALARNPQPARRVFLQHTQALLPLGLAAWAAFSLSFVLANLSYLPTALSDPFGWGWDLFGGAGHAWSPLWSGLAPALQAAALLGGLAWAVAVARRVALAEMEGRRALLQTAPVAAFCLLVALAMMAFLVW
ncbi:MAG: 4Fe-4S binding protein [Chloroflexi bacterium]|nr:4Fe-4S binding protein [Chloroflexota bacterium]